MRGRPSPVRRRQVGSIAWRVRPAQRNRRTENNIGTPRVLGLFLAPEMLESGEFFLTARFCRLGLLCENRLERKPVCRVRRAVASNWWRLRSNDVIGTPGSAK